MVIEIGQEKYGDVMSTPRPSKRFRLDTRSEDGAYGGFGEIQRSASKVQFKELQNYTCNLFSRVRARFTGQRDDNGNENGKVDDVEGLFIAPA